MMTIGKNRIRNHMSLEYNFTGIRILDSSLIPVDWKISIDLVAVHKKARPIEDIEYFATVAYQKLFFWLDTNLPGVVVVDVRNQDDLFIANLSSNLMLYCPDMPYDDMIVELLHSKMNKLVDGDLYVGEMTIKGSDVTALYKFDCIDGIYDLPATTAEYYTEGVARDILPWWNRDDGFCFEFIRPHDSDLTNNEIFKDIVDPMSEFKKAISDAALRNDDTPKEPARIVQVERWKPKKV